MRKHDEAFSRWLRRAETQLPYFSSWQAPAVDRLLKKAFLAGVKQGKKVK